ncbi:MAG: Rne/Rng family ribonuclease [Pyrinomonadaceae bacterium]|nr:Rne/Rng family ribonuclease [Pyrinomonadaceae bacterium]
MSKEMIVSVNGREKKIAILDNGKVTEFYIERGEENSGVVGNVYKGRVMRVLPGMQSAFVDIGLERDAFLYVSDFFDEDEEIERVVMEKNKKGSPEDAKREANEQIDRSRIEREKQMESVQELAEPLAETGVDVVVEPADAHEAETEREPEKGRRGRGRSRGRGREDRDEQPRVEEPQAEEPAFEVEFDNSGFERISDDEESTGEMFKDAYMQEAIQHKVRTIEFDMESTEAAEVGSLLDAVTAESGSFERIADEDDDAPAAPAKGRGKSKAKPKAKAAKQAEAPAEAPAVDAVDTDAVAEVEAKEAKPAAKRKSPSKRGAAAKGKFTKPKAKKKVAGDVLEDAEASEKDSGDTAEMAVRRGGRGRRRGGKAKADENGESMPDVIEDADGNVDDTVETTEAVDAAVEAASDEAAPQQAESADERERSGDERGGRESRNKRGGRGRDRDRQSSDRPSGDRPAGDRPERAERGDRNDRGGRGRNDRNDRGGRPQPLIADLLREGQEILVQIAKEPIAKKGARITSHIALPGRYLVYMPTIEHLGVSRKIESSSERGRLRTLIQRIRQDAEIPAGGFIVRTAGIGISEEDLRNDAKYLARMWAESKKNSEKKRSPAIVHQDLDLVQRILRDQFSDDFTAIRVDSEEEYLRTVEFINLIQPRSVNKVKLYTRDEPILEYYGVQEEIDKALKPRVWLKSGGYLVINQTEALVAIDVNTGKFVGKGNARLEDTITRTNMEAVDEIARQIRLRDLGGIIVLDLIDMDDRRNRHKVSQALQEALSTDRSPTKVLSFNDFGLIIMTRKRVKQSLERTMCAPCDYCEGSGWVKSPTTVCYEILAEARRLSKNVEDVRHTTLRVHPDVARSLRSTEREVLEEIEAYLGHIDVTSDKSIHQGQFDFAFV